MASLGLLRKRRHHEHSEGYWPGYVDALTNVVLNLLFLVAILAAGVFALGMEASRKSLLPALGEIREAPPQKVQQGVAPDKPVVGNVATPIDVARPTLAPDQRLVTLEAVRPEADRTLLQLTFQGEALALAEADRAALMPEIKAAQARFDAATVAVWTVSDKEPTNQRASFVRVMAVRDQLGAAGVDVSQVVTRILPGASVDLHKQRVYVLFNRKRKTNEDE